MFKFSDSSEAKEANRTFLTLALLWTGFIVVIAAITVALVLDEERFLFKAVEHWKGKLGLSS